ncbi:tetratricopeptide repeat protein [Streptomyces siamensis]
MPPASRDPGAPDRGTGHAHGPVPVATADLPAAPAGFTGREDDLARLLPALDPTADTDIPVVICAVSGLGGIGKTSLALYAAHKAVRDGWFPGGTLFVDLRGYDDNPVTAEQALLALLDALGVRGTDLPQTTSAQYALYRTLLARRPPMLVILDNASDPRQLTPLVPGTEGHRVLVTSRDLLTELPARLLSLDTLTPQAAADLITHALLLSDDSDDRPRREPEALRDLAAVCGHHPLALHIAAAILRKRRHRSIADCAGEVLARIKASDAPSLRPIFDIAYGRLPAEQQRLLRLVSLAPTADFSTEVAAALAGLSRDRVLTLLEDLSSAHLVTPVTSAGSVRWRLHDLVRAHAADLTASEPGPAEEVGSARGRVLDHYLQYARSADAQLGRYQRHPAPDLFTNRAEALAWLNAERASIVASFKWEVDRSHAETTVHLARALDGYYLNWRHHYDDWLTIGTTARDAAYLVGDPAEEAASLNSLGYAMRMLGDVEAAVDAHTKARSLYRTTQDPYGEGQSWNNLGTALKDLGNLAASIDAHTRARDLHQASGYVHGEAIAWENLGTALEAADSVTEAIDAYTRARDLYRATDNLAGEAKVWSCLGHALQGANRPGEATEAYIKALYMHLEFESWHEAGRIAHELALIHKAADRRIEARTYFEKAADVFARADADDEAAQARAAARSLT